MGQAVVIPLPAPVDGLIRLPVGLVGPHRLQAASGHAGRRLLRRNSRRHGPQHRRAAGCQLAAVGNQDLKGYTTIRESISDPAIGNIVYHAICESGEGLIRQFSFDPAAHHAYIDRTFRRYQNPYLEDENIRVGREPIRKLDPADRLIKPLLTAYSYGLPVDHLLFGAAAALRFDCPKDAQSVELQAKIRTDGAESALALYTSLTPDHPLFGRILDIYRALAVAAKA